MKNQGSKITMLKSIAGLFMVAVAVSVHAQSAPVRADLDEMQAAAKVGETVLKAALPEGAAQQAYIGKTDDKQWYCSVVLKGSKDQLSSGKEPTPVRACVQLVLKLAHQGVI